MKPTTEPNEVDQVAAGDEAGSRLVRIPAIRPWPDNPRKHFDEQKLEDLAASIGSLGVLQPIVLREITLPAAAKKAGNEALAVVRYEIVCGERRWRAAKIAGLVVIPAIIRQLTDAEVWKIAIVENEQREDISPLEKAAGYHAMIKTQNLKIDDVAVAVGKSASSIRASLRLLQLPAEARQALSRGELAASIAELIAARPSEDMRKKVAAFALTKRRRYGYGDEVLEAPSFREVKEWIQHECVIELKQAPFNLKDETLGGAGACTTCPKRSGNNREAFPEGRADLCTDPHCYRDKIKLHAERLKDAAAKDGTKVLSETEAKAIFPHGPTLSYGAPYFDLGDQCHSAERGTHGYPSYKHLLDKTKEVYHVVLAEDGTGNLRHLVDKEEAIKLLRKHYGIFKNGTSNGYHAPDPEQRKKMILENKIRHKAQEIGLTTAHDIGADVGKQMGILIGAGRDLLRAVAGEILYISHGETTEALCRVHNLEADGESERHKKLMALIETLEERDLMGICAQLVFARNSMNEFRNNVNKAAARAVAIKFAECEKLAKKSVQEEQKARKAKGKEKQLT